VVVFFVVLSSWSSSSCSFVVVQFGSVLSVGVGVHFFGFEFRSVLVLFFSSPSLVLLLLLLLLLVCSFYFFFFACEFLVVV
jgi:hypothetical protein